jgi:hypothetical protein
VHGIVIGDARYDKVFDKLNDRKAVILFHPEAPHVCHCPTHEIPKSPADVSAAWPLPYARPMAECAFPLCR